MTLKVGPLVIELTIVDIFQSSRFIFCYGRAIRGGRMPSPYVAPDHVIASPLPASPQINVRPVRKIQYPVRPSRDRRFDKLPILNRRVFGSSFSTFSLLCVGSSCPREGARGTQIVTATHPPTGSAESHHYAGSHITIANNMTNKNNIDCCQNQPSRLTPACPGTSPAATLRRHLPIRSSLTATAKPPPSNRHTAHPSHQIKWHISPRSPQSLHATHTLIAPSCQIAKITCRSG